MAYAVLVERVERDVQLEQSLYLQLAAAGANATELGDLPTVDARVRDLDTWLVHGEKPPPPTKPPHLSQEEWEARLVLGVGLNDRGPGR